MNEWIESHREKIIYGLLIAVLALLVAIFAMRGSMSREIARVMGVNAAMKEAASAKDRELEQTRAEAAKLTSERDELSGRVASLDASLSGAMAKIDRLDFVAITRGKKSDLLQSEIDGLKKEAARSEAEISKLRDEFDRVFGKAVGVESSDGALPALPDAKSTIALKISDTSGFASIGERVFKTFEGLSGRGYHVPGDTLTAAEAFWGFSAITSEMSMLIEQSSDPGIYFSFLADGIAFDKFAAKSGGGLYWLEKWPGEATGWKLFNDDPGVLDVEPIFYISKLRAKDGRFLILAARTEEGVSAMTRAARGESPSFDAGRVTSGENFCQVKFRDGLTFKEMMESLPREISYAWENLMVNVASAPDLERVVASVTEVSWTRDGRAVNFDSYSDFLEKNPDLLRSRPPLASEAEIFGGGELAFYASADLGFLLRCALFGSGLGTDGIISALGGEFSGPLSGDDVRSIVGNGSVSLGVASDAGKISAAYVMLESGSNDALGKLYSLGRLMDGEPAEIDGWDGAMSWFPGSSFPGYLDLVLAKGEGRLALGLASNGGLAKKISVPESYREYMSRGNLAGIVMSPKFIDVIDGLIDSVVNVANLSYGDEKFIRDVRDYGGAFRDSFDVMSGKLSAGENGKGKIILRDGGDPLAGYMKVFSDRMEQKLPKHDAYEARVIINDLRTLKNASEIYYAYNLKWPTQNELAELEEYEDLSRALRKYERVTITEYEAGLIRGNIGLTLKEENASPGIRRELESKAKEEGLLGKSDSYLDPYTMDSMTVFINMR